ncbi:hypothetical protein L596_023739 [Steinernema carpocapsae]|uniref:Uncharacterized protein n=1 Tax=Steinernema carpocapsae TaxID=34508 RepID=A0A4U5MEK1_STECR|nr:hypothetical protein L596_023739 [Steinernema carpocapsae]
MSETSSQLLKENCDRTSEQSRKRAKCTKLGGYRGGDRTFLINYACKKFGDEEAERSLEAPKNKNYIF